MLFSIDINSAHPHSMLKPMPYQYIQTISYEKSPKIYNNTNI